MDVMKLTAKDVADLGKQSGDHFNEEQIEAVLQAFDEYGLSLANKLDLNPYIVLPVLSHAFEMGYRYANRKSEVNQ